MITTMEREILGAFRSGVTRILVDSPPGAGKTYLVESCAGAAVSDYRWSVGIATHTKNQRDDLAIRFHDRFPNVTLQVLLASGESVPPALAAAGITAVRRPADLVFGKGVIVSTTHRFFYLIKHRFAQKTFDLIIADEAYQIEYKDGLPLDVLAPKRLMVGDPGQIAPFSKLDTEVFETARDHILWALPKEMLVKEPDTTRFSINVSRRLPPDTVKIIQPAFYPNLQFTATSTDHERRLSFAATGLGDRIDRAMDAIGRGASIVAIQLPDVGYEMDVDPEMCDEVIEIVQRLRARRATWQQPSHVLDLSNDVGYCDSHIDSVTAVQTRLRAANLNLYFDDTPNRIQGRETLVTIVKHPLSSLQAADGFHLDPGRLCVMLSRHKLACIVLVRGDLDTLLRTYEHDCGARLAGREDVVWNGYLAHERFWSYLTTNERVFN